MGEGSEILLWINVALFLFPFACLIRLPSSLTFLAYGFELKVQTPAKMLRGISEATANFYSSECVYCSPTGATEAYLDIPEQALNKFRGQQKKCKDGSMELSMGWKICPRSRFLGVVYPEPQAPEVTPLAILKLANLTMSTCVQSHFLLLHRHAHDVAPWQMQPMQNTGSQSVFQALMFGKCLPTVREYCFIHSIPTEPEQFVSERQEPAPFKSMVF